MRDVTDNVTVDLPGMEQRRGRGRPRKAHAMTNAERQAAYRARRKAQQPVDRSVTVTKMLADVDAYDECRLEVDQLREQLDEARREEEIAWRVMREQRDKAEELGRELFQLKKRLLQEKSVTPSNGNLTEIEALRRQLMTCEDGRQEALRYAGALKERLAKFELQQGFVTSSNEKSLMFDDFVAVVGQACAAKRSKHWRSELLESVSLQRLVNFMPLRSFQVMCAAIQDV
ncbi:hypothetical protein NQS38_15845 [Ralstonia pseudosolanacearum]|uniref:hypothetical protein n=1 Tax=Ralstonia pseudosolanacearum TaxID=1310165 RepID=UPI0016981732|nr:hypothetical protein [Ralstonia pseudosolanacearum]NJZ70657.1 hypothetical protein [Ralstonia solanacearum]NJZ79337.1 hypothetical protein [Ralstonia solanacearum]NKF82034.1 hypothetical protein [Ralstonia solanacearum]UYR06356.1 hypothetical protein NQS38_15845 [Ralstonia pseudosolanacearum]